MDTVRPYYGEVSVKMGTCVDSSGRCAKYRPRGGAGGVLERGNEKLGFKSQAATLSTGPLGCLVVLTCIINSHRGVADLPVLTHSGIE